MIDEKLRCSCVFIFGIFFMNSNGSLIVGFNLKCKKVCVV